MYISNIGNHQDIFNNIITLKSKSLGIIKKTKENSSNISLKLIVAIVNWFSNFEFNKTEESLAKIFESLYKASRYLKIRENNPTEVELKKIIQNLRDPCLKFPWNEVSY